MFTSDTHLPQVLPPEAYFSAAQHQREMTQLFVPGWHVIGCIGDIPKPGDYFTANLGSYPLIVRNFGDEIHTFLNVCSHRFCAIASAKRGHSEQLKCQYHGWEFDAAGETRLIPDAPSFRPLEKGRLGLTRFRTALCGQLIFVSLTEAGPTLPEFLGTSYATYSELFSDAYDQILAADWECEANWKLAVENGLESYHVDCVHATTFGKTPAAKDCTHDLRPDATVFRTPSSNPGTVAHRLETLLARSQNREPTHEYMNLRTYPSLTCSKTDTVTFVQSILPLEPTRCMIIYRLFSPRPSASAWITRLMSNSYRRGFKKYWLKVFLEDQQILPKIQHGMQAPWKPRGGLISAREERIFHFQNYVNRHCQEFSVDTTAASQLPAHPEHFCPDAKQCSHPGDAQ